jgi:hypothetical protein
MIILHHFKVQDLKDRDTKDNKDMDKDQWVKDMDKDQWVKDMDKDQWVKDSKVRHSTVPVLQ